MTRTPIALALALALIVSACGGDGSTDEADTGSTTSDLSDESTGESEAAAPEESESDTGDASVEGTGSGAFAVDLEGSRLVGVQVAAYDELNVHQVEADDSTVWVTVGDAANEADAYVARYDLAGSEIARIGSSGRPLGIAADPDGRGVWFGDTFHGNVDFIDGTSVVVESSVDNAVSSLSSTILSDAGSIWSLRSRDGLARIDVQEGVIAEEILVPFESTPGDLLMVEGTLWGSDALSDSVTAVDLATSEPQVFDVVSGGAMVLLDTGMVLVSGEQLVTIDPATGTVTELGAVVYPDKNELFPAQFTSFATTSHGLYGFDGVHGRLVRLDLTAFTAEVIDDVPIGFVGVGDIAESADGNLWLVVAGEETDTDSEDHLRLYEMG